MFHSFTYTKTKIIHCSLPEKVKSIKEKLFINYMYLRCQSKRLETFYKMTYKEIRNSIEDTSFFFWIFFSSKLLCKTEVLVFCDRRNGSCKPRGNGNSKCNTMHLLK